MNWLSDTTFLLSTTIRTAMFTSQKTVSRLSNRSGDEVIALRSFKDYQPRTSSGVDKRSREMWLSSKSQTVRRFTYQHLLPVRHIRIYSSRLSLRPHIEKLEPITKRKGDWMLRALEAWFPVEAKWPAPMVASLFGWYCLRIYRPGPVSKSD